MSTGDLYYIHPTHHEELFGSDRPVSAGEMKLAVYGELLSCDGIKKISKENIDKYLTYIDPKLVVNADTEQHMLEHYTSLIESIKKNGMLDPPTVWDTEKTKYWVYEGHHRCAAAKMLKMKKILVLYMLLVAKHYPNNITNKNIIKKRKFDWLIKTFQKEKHVKLYEPPTNTEFNSMSISLDEWYMLHRFLNKCKPKRILDYGGNPSSILFQHWTEHKIERGHGVNVDTKDPSGKYDFAFIDYVTEKSLVSEKKHINTVIERKIKSAMERTNAIIFHDIDRDHVTNLVWDNLLNWKRTDFEDCPRLALFERPSDLEVDKKFDTQPFVTIITRTCRRPNALIKNMLKTFVIAE